jgi:hypothetical protein
VSVFAMLHGDHVDEERCGGVFAMLHGALTKKKDASVFAVLHGGRIDEEKI